MCDGRLVLGHVQLYTKKAFVNCRVFTVFNVSMFKNSRPVNSSFSDPDPDSIGSVDPDPDQDPDLFPGGLEYIHFLRRNTLQF
jgi:hypothetical protein